MACWRWKLAPCTTAALRPLAETGPPVLRLHSGFCTWVERILPSVDPESPHQPASIASRLLGLRDHANRGNRRHVLDQYLVHGELGEAELLAQPVRQVAISAGLRVARAP